MARYSIPTNSGKFTVCTAQGGHYVVWNRKTGKHEIVIPVRSRKQADEICNTLNRKAHNGTIEVLQ